MFWPFSGKPRAVVDHEQSADANAVANASANTVPNAPEHSDSLAAQAWPEPVWRIVGESVRGASHIKDNKPNQDALLWKQVSANGSRNIIALADGHGSTRFFRSQRGSSFAVAVTAAILEQFLRDIPSPYNPSQCKHAAESFLPDMIVDAWLAAVAEDLACEPFRDDELSMVEDAEGAEQRNRLMRNPHKAYGSTLLAVVTHENFILGVQIGDGEIKAIMENGDVAEIVAEDPGNFANETASLSSERPQAKFRVAYHHLAGRPPVGLMITTDGYANAIETQKFDGVLREWIEGLRDEGIEKIQECMSGVLNHASQFGSGDDCTVAFVFRLNSDFSQWPTMVGQSPPSNSSDRGNVDPTDGPGVPSPSDSDVNRRSSAGEEPLG